MGRIMDKVWFKDNLTSPVLNAYCAKIYFSLIVLNLDLKTDNVVWGKSTLQDNLGRKSVVLPRKKQGKQSMWK